MLHSKPLRHAVVATGLAALSLAPLPVRAAGTDAPPAGSPAGVVMAVICGASIAIARIQPVPIVVAVGAVACFTMLADAWATPDVP